MAAELPAAGPKESGPASDLLESALALVVVVDPLPCVEFDEPLLEAPLFPPEVAACASKGSVNCAACVIALDGPATLLPAPPGAAEPRDPFVAVLSLEVLELQFEQPESSDWPWQLSHGRSIGTPCSFCAKESRGRSSKPAATIDKIAVWVRSRDIVWTVNAPFLR